MVGIHRGGGSMGGVNNREMAESMYIFYCCLVLMGHLRGFLDDRYFCTCFLDDR